MQEYRPLESGKTRFDELYGRINTMFKVLQSQFSGEQYPPNPVPGQPCFRIDMKPPRVFVFNGQTWEDPTMLSPVITSHSQELERARGTAATLEARLDVAMHQDGTLRGTLPVGGWWAQEAGVVERVSENQFKVQGDRRAVYTNRRAVMLEQDKDGQSWVADCLFKDGVTVVTLADGIVDIGLTSVSYGQDVGSEPAAIDILPPLGKAGQCLGVSVDGKNLMYIDAVPLSGRPGQVLTIKDGKLVWSDRYELCEFYSWRHPTLKPGFLPAQGGLITDAATRYPDAWAYLQTAEGQKLCTTENNWQAMTRAVWHINADGSRVGWDGIGGAPYYAPNWETGELRLPDLRGMYMEAAGFDSLGVGGTHGDGMRHLYGSFILWGLDAVPIGVFRTLDGYADYVSGVRTGHGKAMIFENQRYTPVANKNQPRAWGALACVYLGIPK